jgi:hypothetical protein
MRNLRTSLLLIFAAVIVYVLAMPSHAVFRFDFPRELIGRAYETETRLKKDGSLIGRSTAKFEQKSYKGRQFLVITGQSNSRIDEKSFASEISRTYLLEDGRITADSIKATTKTAGKPWTDSYIAFDWKNMTARVVYKDLKKNEAVDKNIVLDTKMVAVQDLELYLSSLPYRNVSEEKLKALLPNGQTFGFLIKMADTLETISVKGQTILCRKVELKPDLGFISFVIPNVNYWINSEPPYEMVRYSGLLSGPGSPDVVIETVASE